MFLDTFLIGLAELMFLVLFLKRTNSGLMVFWGQPQTPWLRFAEWLGSKQPRRANVFGSFFKKNEFRVDGFLGPAPDPVAPLRGEFGVKTASQS
jgi:hypothetical protein